MSKISLISLILLLTFNSACFGKKKQEAAPTAPAAPAAMEAKTEKTEAPAPTATAPKLATPIDSVKGFFDAISKEQYDIAWASLTRASQDANRKIHNLATEIELTGELPAAPRPRRHPAGSGRR